MVKLVVLDGLGEPFDEERGEVVENHGEDQRDRAEDEGPFALPDEGIETRKDGHRDSIADFKSVFYVRIIYDTNVTELDEQTIIQNSRNWVKKNSKLLIEKFCSIEKFPPVENPFTIFMAGSPGAGKTEFSKSFIDVQEEENPKLKIVRIDADEVRNEIPFYDGKNSYLFQGAASLGVEKIFDYVKHNQQNCVVDGTLASYEVAKKNIENSISKNRKVSIFYLYQDPFVAWNFTLIREEKEGRNIPKQAFVNALFSAKDNVQRLKTEYGKTLLLNVVIRNFENKVEKTYFNVDSIDSYVKLGYNADSLKKDLLDSILVK